MKHLRKCTALLLAVLMVLALAACGEKDTGSAVDKTSIAEAANPRAVPKNRVFEWMTSSSSAASIGETMDSRS